MLSLINQLINELQSRFRLKIDRPGGVCYGDTGKNGTLPALLKLVYLVGS